MTASTRIGDNLPELLEELGAPRVPDYFDDLLRTTAATRQRPEWASLERWLPVTSISRPAPFGLPSWQPIVLLVLLLVAAAIGGALVIGSQPRLPAPFGPAQNGVLLASGVDGTLLAIDPANATATTVSNGSGRYHPWHSPDGTRMLYFTKDADGVENALFVANADGSSARQLDVDVPNLDWVEWTPKGDAVLVLSRPGPDQDARLINVATGGAQALDFDGLEVSSGYFRPNGELVFAGHTPSPSSWAYYVTSFDGTPPRALTGQVGREGWGFALSPDGATLAYSLNDDPPAVRGEIHLVDITSGVDRPAHLAGYTSITTLDLNPAFSPDGTLLLLNRYDEPDSYGTPYLVRVDGTGAAIKLTPRPSADVDQVPDSVFSPDGSELVLRYAEDLSVWIYDTATGAGRRVEGVKVDGMSWQRR